VRVRAHEARRQHLLACAVAWPGSQAREGHHKRV
jgi:hypothetical protein